MDRKLVEEDKLDRRRNKKELNPWFDWRPRKRYGPKTEVKPGVFRSERAIYKSEIRAEYSKSQKNQHNINLRLSELALMKKECLEAIKSLVQTSKNEEVLSQLEENLADIEEEENQLSYQNTQEKSKKKYSNKLRRHLDLQDEAVYQKFVMPRISQILEMALSWTRNELKASTKTLEVAEERI